MKNLIATGKQKFMGKDIPVILGGFGQNKKCVSDKTVAEIHSMEIKHVRELINRNINRFKDGVDYLDLKVVVQNDDNFTANLGYSKMQISKAEHIYILSERGYAKLIKIMDTDLAWEIHDKLIDEYFDLREKQKPLTLEQMMRIQLGMVDKHEERLDRLENTMNIDYAQQKQIKNFAAEVVVSALGGKDSKAYKHREEDGSKISSQTFSRFWHDFNDYFNINAYANLPRVRFKEALEYINRWQPPTNMQLEIGRINRGKEKKVG